MLFLAYIGSSLPVLGPVLNHDGTAPDHAVRDLAMLPGPPALWLGEWVAGPIVTIGVDDVAQWPHTPGLLVKWGFLSWFFALACWEDGPWFWWYFLC